MKIKPISMEVRRTILLVASTIVNASILVFSLLSFSLVLFNAGDFPRWFLAITFFLLCVSMADLAIYEKVFSNNTIGFYKNLALSIVDVGLGIAAIFAEYAPLPFCIIAFVFLLSIAGNRIVKIFEKPKPFSIVFNGLLAGVSIFVGVFSLIQINEETFSTVMILMCMVIFLVALLNTMIFAFSKIQLRTLLKIMRKTYALEVLYGLVVLIFSFSFVFYVFEPNMNSYGDALWYSFAIITTIGFGDFTTTSLFTRILSVILGIYGIIVVACITSVIVNFYNEVKNDDDKTEKKEQIEDKTEEEKKE